MNKTLFTEESIREYTIIPINYNLTEIWNQVRLTEYIHIVPIIGMNFYQELVKQVEQDNISEDNKELLTYIWAYEGVALIDVCMPQLAYRLNESGITKAKSDYVEALDVNELNYYATYIHSHLDPLKTILINYLQANSALFPLYKEESQPDNSKIYGLGVTNTDVDGNKFLYQ